jgi:predicted phage terminase large subunit-like protein
LQIYGASDYAVSAGKGDYTVHLAVGLDQNDELWLLDLWRGQKTPDVWVEKWCDFVLRWKPVAFAEEAGQIAASVGPLRDRVARERGAYCALRRFPTKGDKSARAQSIRGRMAMRGLHVPVNVRWYADFRSELLTFPVGTHDDMVDALGLIGVSLPGARTMHEFITADHVWKCMDQRTEYEVGLYDALVLAVLSARFRGEPTVLCLRRGRDARTVPTVKLRDLDSMAIAGRVAELNERWHPETIFIDSSGLGAAVVDRCNFLRLPVRAVDFSAAPDGQMQTANSGIRFYDRRSEMYGRMRDWLEAGAMLGDDQDLATELTSIEYNYAARDGLDGLVIEGREELRKRGLPPCNNADALALTFAYRVGKADQRWKYGRPTSYEAEYDPLSWDRMYGSSR